MRGGLVAEEAGNAAVNWVDRALTERASRESPGTRFARIASVRGSRIRRRMAVSEPRRSAASTCREWRRSTSRSRSKSRPPPSAVLRAPARLTAGARARRKVDVAVDRHRRAPIGTGARRLRSVSGGDSTSAEHGRGERRAIGCHRADVGELARRSDARCGRLLEPKVTPAALAGNAKSSVVVAPLTETEPPPGGMPRRSRSRRRSSRHSRTLRSRARDLHRARVRRRLRG